MKLFYTPNSPYARITRVAALEAGLEGHLDFHQAKLRSPDNPLLAHCPLGRVPTLVDGDLVLGQAQAICAYFDVISEERRFFPDQDWQAKSVVSLTSGFLDGIAVWVRELRRPEPEQSGFLLEVEQARATRCLDRFEREVAAGRFGEGWDFAHIQLACTLGIIDRSLQALAWREGRPALAAWFAAQDARPSMAATHPVPA